MEFEKPPLLFTFLVTSGLYSVLQLEVDSEQYVNRLGFSGRPVPSIYHVSSLWGGGGGDSNIKNGGDARREY